MKQACLDYFFINPSGKTDKFMANNWFGKKIILLNKDKIYLFANATSDKFLKEIIAINVISLCKCQEVVSHTTVATSYSNCYSLAAKRLDISLLIKHMTEEFPFYKQFGQIAIQDNA